MSEVLNVDTVTLEWIKVTAANAVTPEFAESVKAEVLRQHVWGPLVHQLTANVLAERLPEESVSRTETFIFEVPASPWQQFKQDHAASWWLRWLVRRRPPVVRTHKRTGELTVDVSRFWTYPEARIANMGRPIRAMTLNAEQRWWS